MDFWETLQKKQNDVRLIKIINRAVPFVGRIVTREKSYAGLIKELKLFDGRLKFTITDCDKNGQSRENAETYCEEVAWESFIDIETWFKNGKFLWLIDLIELNKEDENE